MLQHVVLLRFPEPLGEAGLTELRALLQPLAAEAGFIQGMRLGRSSSEWTGGYEYLLYVELTAASALPDYLNHPRHVAVGRWIQNHLGDAIVFDYTVDETTVISSQATGG